MSGFTLSDTSIICHPVPSEAPDWRAIDILGVELRDCIGCMKPLNYKTSVCPVLHYTDALEIDCRGPSCNDSLWILIGQTSADMKMS